MSLHIDHAFGLTGNGVNIGQVEQNVPAVHPNVPRTVRAGDAPLAGDTHPLEVAGIMISNNATNTGMAPDARLFSDGYGNNGIAGTTLTNDNNFLDAIRWQTTIAPVAKVVNSSHQLLLIAGGQPAANGMQKATLGNDWYILQQDFLYVKSAGNAGAQPVTVPGDSYNGLTVGAATNPDALAGVTSARQGPVNRRWNRLADYSNWGTNAAGHSKPDLVAPGGLTDGAAPTGFQMATLAGGFASTANEVGTSFAAPHVSGVAAQLYQLQPGASHRLMKSALVNGADHTVRNRADQPWTAATNGLDAQLGTGFLDAWSSAAQLQAGGGRIGTQEGGLIGGNQTTDVVTLNNVGPDARVVATVVWNRRVNRDAVAPPNETYTVDPNQASFDLLFNRQGGGGASIISGGGASAHLNQVLTQGGNYTLQLRNKGNSANAAQGQYAVAWAVSPPDVNPNSTDPVYFTVRDQIHRVNGAGQDRILEGRIAGLTAVNGRAQADAGGQAVGVETTIFRSAFDGNSGIHRTGVALGLQELAAAVDDHVNDISFGKDDVRGLTFNGGRMFFSVDAYATGLSPRRPGNPQTGVYDEATIVNESAGDVFLSNMLLPGAAPVTNGNAKTRNNPGTDFLHPVGPNSNATYADSYYMGLVGGRVADNEDDVTGLEGLGGKHVNPTARPRDGFIFFTLDRDSPTGRLGDVLVAREDTPNQFRTFASAGQLGLGANDNIDGLCVELLSDLGADGWPVYNPAIDWLLFSVDRDSTGLAGSDLRRESTEGEVAGDVFFGSTTGSNLLYLEGTDLGLQEFALGNSLNWLTDNLDAIDLPDVLVPEPTSAALVVLGALALMRRARRRMVMPVPR
jgi:hypothetical protein